MVLDAKIPEGPLAEKWDRHRFELKLVNPANKRKFNIIVVGTGLAGGSASATEGLTALPLKGASTRPKTTPTTVIASGVFFTTPSKAAILEPERPMSIV